jgi:hypothetical protein
MKLPLTGGCQCGQLRYEVNAEPLSVYVCHCTECQRQSGSAFGMSVLLSRAAFRFVKGHAQRYSRTADSGRIIDGDFCETCGVRPVHYPKANEAVAILKPGTLDDTSWLHPVGHIWTRSAQQWVSIPAGSVIHEGHPSELNSLIEAWQRYRQTM